MNAKWLEEKGVDREDKVPELVACYEKPNEAREVFKKSGYDQTRILERVSKAQNDVSKE